MANDAQDNRGRGFVGRLVDSVVSPVVQPVVNAVDVEHVVEQIDLNATLERVDLNALIERIELDEVLDRIDPNRLLDRVDADRLLDRIDPDRLLDRIDPNRLLDRVEPDRLLDRVEPNRLLDRVDADRLLDRVDADRLLDRVDPNRLLDRVDTDRLLDRIDMNALIKRTELGDIIARSTTGVFGQLLDVGRTAVMSVDLVVQGTVTRILRRPEPSGQLRPDDPTARTQVRSLPRIERAVALQGHYAGSPSRFLAFTLDTFLGGALFTIGMALFTFALEIVTGVTWVNDEHRLLISVAYVLWMLLYLAVPTGVAGRTIGKAVLGLFVVRSDGAHIDLRHAFVRTVVFPLSFLMFGIGFLLGLVRRDRRQLHDLIADTAVVYAWDADVARMRARSTEPIEHTNA